MPHAAPARRAHRRRPGPGRADRRAVVGSDELYVTWTHARPVRRVPEIEAELREPQPTRGRPVADVVVALVQGIAALWHALTGPPARRRAGSRRPAAARASRAALGRGCGRAVGGRVAGRRRPASGSPSGGLAPSRAHGSSNSTRHLPSSVCIERQPRAERAARAALEAGHRPSRCGRVAISSRATAGGSVLPALDFQITKPQPGSSRDQHEKPLRFSTMSWPQTGHGPRLARGMRTSLSFASSSCDGRAGELGDVGHEAARATPRPCSISAEPVLPVAGQRRRGQRVLVEQADHVEALLGADQRAAVALDVADVDQALDDRRARGRRADPGVLHRLAQLVVVDELAGGLHRAPAATRRSSAAAAWSPSRPAPTSRVSTASPRVELRQRWSAPSSSSSTRAASLAAPSP